MKLVYDELVATDGKWLRFISLWHTVLGLYFPGITLENHEEPESKRGFRVNIPRVNLSLCLTKNHIMMTHDDVWGM
jgi:hypothetical protein